MKSRTDQLFLGSTNACNAIIPPAVNSTNPSHLGGFRAFLGDGAVCIKTSLATELASTALVFVIWDLRGNKTDHPVYLLRPKPPWLQQ